MRNDFYLKTCLLILLSTSRLYAQVTIPNNGFEEADKTSASKTASWKPESDNFDCTVDNKQFFRGNSSLRLESKTEGHHFFNQEFSFTSSGLKKYKLRCAVKTKNLTGELYLGARVFDKDGNTLTKMIFPVAVHKQQDWTIAEGFFISEIEAANIRVFGSLFGTGQAWFDEFTIAEMQEPGARSPDTSIAMYIHEYFDLVYEHSVVSDKAVIANLKSATMYLCADVSDVKDCRYILQQFTTKKLNDGHSFFATPEEWKLMMEQGKHPSTGKKLQSMPTGNITTEHIAYLRLPTFLSSDEKLIKKYADTLQSLIAEFDKQNPHGWIVDLSHNNGGNCFPMIAGVGPLIGNGVCEHSFSGDGSVRQIIYNNGWTGVFWIGGDSLLVLLKPDAYQLINKNKPVAVIYGAETASSGEVTAISFIGLPYTKSFGQYTYGVSTRVDNFELSDGSYLNLAAGVEADRNGNRFGGKIKPDIETTDNEGAISAAKKWILSEPE